MTKVAVNRCYGGFDVSAEAQVAILKRKGLECFFYEQTKYDFQDGKNEYVRRTPKEIMVGILTFTFTKDFGPVLSEWPGKDGDDSYFYCRDLPRDDPDLIAVIEELGPAASGRYGKIEVVEIPDGIKWVIDEYDGMEHVEEEHRSW